MHAFAANLGADPLDLLLDHGRRRPGRRRVGDAVEEVLEDVLAVRRVHDLGVELDAVEVALGASKAATGVDGDVATTCAPSGACVTVSRWLIQTVCSPGVPSNSARPPPRARLAELRDAGAVDCAAELERHQLGAVADAERGDAELEQLGVDVRRAFRVDRGRPAAQDERERVARTNPLRRDVMRNELGVDAALAHAARDQLRVLAAEVDDEDRALLRRGFLQRQRDDLAHQNLP